MLAGIVLDPTRRTAAEKCAYFSACSSTAFTVHVRVIVSSWSNLDLPVLAIFSRAGHLRYILDLLKIESTYFFKTITLQPISAPFLSKNLPPVKLTWWKCKKYHLYHWKIKKIPQVPSSDFYTCFQTSLQADPFEMRGGKESSPPPAPLLRVCLQNNFNHVTFFSSLK